MLLPLAAREWGTGRDTGRVSPVPIPIMGVSYWEGPLGTSSLLVCPG